MKLKITYLSLFFLLIAINSVYAHGDYKGLVLFFKILQIFPAVCMFIFLLIVTFKVKKLLNYFLFASILCLFGGFYISVSGEIIPMYILLISPHNEDVLRITFLYILQVILFFVLLGIYSQKESIKKQIKFIYSPIVASLHTRKWIRYWLN